MTEMKISVVIPTLNEEKNIRACLRSIKRQTLKPLEIIVCDGNSKDKTRQIAKKYADRVIIEKKRSAAAERQKGANIAKGDIIAFIDSDSMADPRWLERTAHAFKDHRVSGVYGPVLLFDGNILDRFMSKYIFNNYVKITHHLGKPSPAGINMSVRKSAFKRIGGFDTDLKTAEDLDLFRKLAKEGKIAYCNAIVFSSARRLKKWGYLKFFAFHIDNVLRFHSGKKAHTEYEDVR